MFRNRYVKVQASYSAALPCKTLLELTVGWAAGVLARDTTFAMTGVESFLKEGGPEEEAGAMERFAGHSGQKKMRISSKIIEKKSISETTPTLQICLQMKEAAVWEGDVGVKLQNLSLNRSWFHKQIKQEGKRAPTTVSSRCAPNWSNVHQAECGLVHAKNFQLILYWFWVPYFLQPPSLSGKLCPFLGSVIFLPFVCLSFLVVVDLSSPSVSHSLQKLIVPIPVASFLPSFPFHLFKETATALVNLGIDSPQESTLNDTERGTLHLPTDCTEVAGLSACIGICI